MSPTETPLTWLLVVGAHPDDIEFGCGAVVVQETRSGRPAHLVVCSDGEAGTFGTPEIRRAEATQGATHLGASLEFVAFDGDAHLTIHPAHAIKLARIVRQQRPAIVLAPTVMQNQHPDHWRLGTLVRDAVRLARYGGVAELKDLAPHAISQLLFYALTPEAEPRDVTPLLVDVSSPAIVEAWTAAMNAHASQMQVRRYVDLCLKRAQFNGLRAGVEYAIALFPNDPIVIKSLAQLSCGARGF
jgi:LmbE family N-acetylglucosaminyl deacetylase